MTQLETAIRPIYNLVYLALALGLANLIGFVIYRMNVKRHGQREAYASGWAVSVPLCVVIFIIWAWCIA